MTGRLYVIGIGPGDPELLTLKAVKTLKDVLCICVPKGREGGGSLALSIVKEIVDLNGKEIIEAYFPMRKTKQHGKEHNSESCELDRRWQETVETLLSKLNKGVDVAFLTMGDPTIYSTFFYLYDSLLELNPELDVEIIPGVSSINASASKAKVSLGLANERIAVLPANYIDDLTETLRKFDTVVLMKVHRDFERILKSLDEAGLLECAIYASRVGMKDEKILRNLRNARSEDLNYFSMIIIKK